MQQKSATNVTLSNRLRTLMNRDEVNASEVARAVKMTHVGVGHYLRGNRIPGAVELYRIAKYFGVPMEYFLESEVAAREMLRRSAKSPASTRSSKTGSSASIAATKPAKPVSKKPGRAQSARSSRQVAKRSKG